MQNQNLIINADLADRQTLPITYPRLLIGNGASMAVWSRFGYSSLFEVAQTNGTNQLTPSDLDLFNSLTTTNFERVLYYLYVTSIVNPLYHLDNVAILDSYANIRSALIEAVKRVHVPWAVLTGELLNEINTALAAYRHVYSTNYDLLTYWGVMHNPGGFRDFFWNDSSFDVSNTEVWGAHLTTILYPHGGLHLCRDPYSNESIKRQAASGQNLLDLFGSNDGERQLVPLFVAEGTSDEKLRTIFGSDYLTFAYLSLSQNRGPLDIFGLSLGDSDDHIIQAINRSQTVQIAISIHPDYEENIVSRKLAILSLFSPSKNIVFYDARTHPLGAATLRIPE